MLLPDFLTPKRPAEGVKPMMVVIQEQIDAIIDRLEALAGDGLLNREQAARLHALTGCDGG